jgi:tetratricopeptide (TPR) repeat protein
MKNFILLLAGVFICVIFLSSCSKKESAEKHFKKGLKLYISDSLDQAIVEYKKALEIDSTLVKAYLNLGAAYTKKGEYDSAISSFKNALSYNPYDIKTHYNLGKVYSIKNDTAKVLEEADFLKKLGSSLGDSLKKLVQ